MRVGTSVSPALLRLGDHALDLALVGQQLARTVGGPWFSRLAGP